MNKIKMLAASVLFVFAVSSVNMIACDKAKYTSTKSSCNTGVKSACCETANVKKVAAKEAKGDCSTKCSDTKTAVKTAKSSCCPSAKETKLEATKVSNEVKTVAESPSK